MANTTEQVQDHALFKSIVQLRERVAQIQTLETELPEGMFERIVALCEMLLSRIEQSDKIMIPTQALDQTQNHVHNTVTELNNYNSNKNSVHIQNAIKQIGSASQSFPSVFKIESEDSYSNVLNLLSQRTSDQIKKLTKASNRTKSELNQTHEALSNLGAKIEHEQQRITDGLGNVETQFTESQGSRSKAFNEALNGFLASLQTALKNSDAKIRSHIENSEIEVDVRVHEILTRLESIETDSLEKHSDILEIYGIVGRDSQIGGYKQNADTAKTAGEFWDRITFIFMVLAIFVLVGPSLISYFVNGFTPINWTQVLSRFPISTVLLLPAAYAGAQARRQKKAYDTATRNQLHIAALGPYLSTLPKTTQDKIRALLAPRFFYADNSETLDIEKLFEKVSPLGAQE